MIIENNIFTTIILTSYLSVLGSVSGVVLCIVLLCIFIYQTIVPLPSDSNIHTVHTSIHYLYNADILAQVSSLGLLRYLLYMCINAVYTLASSTHHIYILCTHHINHLIRVLILPILYPMYTIYILQLQLHGSCR